ncbi:DUF4065 domain-containing protein [Massilia sp. G4R7]|uniref:DUF4065 domain-containing protein n=1 Tax=Massilia phyllostachyos TaxID=2898585 RepID=A0ABS8Q7L0_9BURK|nr:type II toxin-antitoxin system antitoxin SocA domain-containing protein [Massilia phyllostachyos]MCD2517042.1 DUF4065 domain-containing protein [Massilia phyllostachyos]
MTSALDVAQVFLNFARDERRRLTNMQLQKLVFFAHGIHLGAFDGEPLIEEEVRAWDFGPVIPVLYEELRRYGRGNVEDDLVHELPPELHDSESSQMEAIRTAWASYKDMTAWQLSEISHLDESPWAQVWNQRRYAPIPDRLIRDYYRQHLDIQNAD